MSNDNPNPSILSHVSLGTNQFEAARSFYDATMAALGIKRVEEFPGAVAYGKQFPEFWVQTPINGEAAASANGSHVSFLAESPAQVDAWHAAVLAHGGTDEGAPGGREHYGPGYYGAFARDLDGHKIEAMFWDETAQ